MTLQMRVTIDAASEPHIWLSISEPDFSAGQTPPVEQVSVYFESEPHSDAYLRLTGTASQVAQLLHRALRVLATETATLDTEPALYEVPVMILPPDDDPEPPAAA